MATSPFFNNKQPPQPPIQTKPLKITNNNAGPQNGFVNQQNIQDALRQYYANLGGTGQYPTGDYGPNNITHDPTQPKDKGNNNWMNFLSGPGMPGIGSMSNIGSGNFNYGDIPGLLGDPLGSMILGNLLGDKNKFKPYLDKHGNLVYSGERNTVPVSNIPGSSVLPGKDYGKTANSIRAITDLLPYYTQATNATLLPTELSKLQTAQATSGPYAELMTNLYNTFGQQLNDIGNKISNTNALSEAQTQQDVINGPGKGLVNSAYDLSQVFDKPWYDTRAATSKALNEQLAGGLSQTERDEIAKGLARQNTAMGTANTDSNTNTVSNAMQFGKAGRDRLSEAIRSASAFLPTARSGVDVFQVATGKPSAPNSGNAMFPGINKASGGTELGQQMFGGINSLQQQQSQINANKKDWLDQMNQFTSSLSQIGSMAGGVQSMAKCWVAREVYGANNPKWLMFRAWLESKAPKWFHDLYVENGERFAVWLKNKTTLKSIIRKWMDNKIKTLNT